MTLSPTQLTSKTFENPVYRQDFADPFVFKHCGEYWAYCSGFWKDGRAFGILRSRDLVQWEEVGGAMEPLPGGHTCYWAPEVTYDNGLFYLYYSVGNEEQMEIRVAVGEEPGGPFVDSGHRLTREPFAIDAHVFQDDDGTRYLFYATDYLEHSHVGTGTARDRMVDFFTLAGERRPVTRALYDWQVYDPQRKEKGGARWHTIEGSFVLKHKGLYYQMFSGGNWQNVSYGVSYAMTETMDRAEEWAQVADGEQVLPILRTIPQKVIGPGHNSVVRGPDGQQLYCVYHRWAEDRSGRQMAIDPMDWAGKRMLVLGPSTTPQPAPLRPTFADFFDGTHMEGLGANWDCQGGYWTRHDGAAHQKRALEVAEASCPTEAPSFVLETSVRAEPRRLPTGALDLPPPHGGFGVSLYAGVDEIFRVLIVPMQGSALFSVRDGHDWKEETRELPGDFKPGAWHLLRVEVDGPRIRACLDDLTLRWEGKLAGDVTSAALRTQEVAAAFAGFALTAGWQDWFTENVTGPAELGWEGNEADWKVEQAALRYSGNGEGILVKGPLLDAYEWVANARLNEMAASDSVYGFYPALRSEGQGPLLMVDTEGNNSVLRWRDEAGEQVCTLPDGFDATQFQQFRFRKEQGRLRVQWEEHFIVEGEVPQDPTRVALYARGPGAEWDGVRVTGMKDEG